MNVALPRTFWAGWRRCDWLRTATIAVSTLSSDDDGDGVADGRDLARISGSLDWRRNWTTPSGFAISALSTVAADSYVISQDDDFGGSPRRFSGAAAVELRWPWVKSTAGNVTHLIEPVVQAVLVVAPACGHPERRFTPLSSSMKAIFSHWTAFPVTMLSRAARD